MKLHVNRFALTLLAFSALPAFAGSFSYNFVELGYADQEIDLLSNSADQNGYDIRGSYEFHPSFFAQAYYTDQDGEQTIEQQSVDFKNRVWSLSAGWHTALNAKSDVFVMYSYENNAVSFDHSDLEKEDRDVNAIEAGVRFKPITTIEIFASAAYLDADGSENDTGYKLGTQFSLADNVHLGLSYGERFNSDFSRVYLQVSF